MDLMNANTEPYYQFHRRNEEFNRTMRITVAGLSFVRQQQRSVSGPAKLPTDGEPFGINLWNNPAQGVTPAKRFIAQMGVVRAVTLLEDLCVGIKAEYDRFTSFVGAVAKSSTVVNDEEDGLSPRALFTNLGFKEDVLDSTEPLYNYFSKMRNCIVHRSGRATAELSEHAVSPRLTACVDEWKGPRGKKLPALPTVTTGDDLALLPRHAILASEVCRRIAVDANAQLLNYLSENGVVYMAAYHSLLSERPVLTAARNTPQAVLNYFLTDRNRVQLESRDEAVRILSRMGRWKPYLRKFERLKARGQLK